MREYEEILRNKSYRWNIGRFANKECLSAFDWELSESQEEVLGYLKYKENRKIIISAAAGVGKTVSMAIFSLWIAGVLSYALDKRLSVNILGGSQKQSKICYRYIKAFLENSEYLSDRLKKKPLKTKTIFDNGSRIAALTASSKSVRGEHPDVLIIDEAVEVEDNLINAALPRVNTQVFPKKILCSTPHSYSSYFVDLWNKADDFNFEKFHWSAEDVDWKEDEEIEEAKEFYDDSIYKIEYQGTPSAVSGTVIKQDDMKHSIVSQEYKPDLEAFKTAGVDWGSTHPTAIVVLQNVDNYLQVIECKAWKHQKFTWLQNQIKSIYDDYEIDLVYGDNSHKGENERLQKKGLNLKSIPITGNKKGSLIAELRHNFEIGKIKIPAKFKKLIRELKRYTRDTKRGEDRIDGLMLAVDAQKKAKNTVSKAEPLWSSG